MFDMHCVDDNSFLGHRGRREGRVFVSKSTLRPGHRFLVSNLAQELPHSDKLAARTDKLVARTC